MRMASSGDFGLRQVRQVMERFGIPEEALKGLEFELGTGAVFVGTPEVMAFSAVKPLRRGLRFCRLFPRSVKPATHAMQLLGHHATRNTIAVTTEEAVVLANGGTVTIEADASDGFVLVTWQEFVLGTGLYHRPLLRSQMPRFRPVDYPAESSQP